MSSDGEIVYVHTVWLDLRSRNAAVAQGPAGRCSTVQRAGSLGLAVGASRVALHSTPLHSLPGDGSIRSRRSQRQAIISPPSPRFTRRWRHSSQRSNWFRKSPGKTPRIETDVLSAVMELDLPGTSPPAAAGCRRWSEVNGPANCWLWRDVIIASSTASPTELQRQTEHLSAASRSVTLTSHTHMYWNQRVCLSVCLSTRMFIFHLMLHHLAMARSSSDVFVDYVIFSHNAANGFFYGIVMTHPRLVIWEVFLRTCFWILSHITLSCSCLLSSVSFFSFMLLPVGEIKMNIMGQNEIRRICFLQFAWWRLGAKSDCTLSVLCASMTRKTVAYTSVFWEAEDLFWVLIAICISLLLRGIRFSFPAM